jgi:hypothetical protein
LSELDKRQNFPLKSRKPPEKNRIAWSCFGRPGFKLIVSINDNEDWLCVNFGIDANDQKHHLSVLKAKRDIIEKAFGTKLRWEPFGNERSNTQAILTKYKEAVRDRLQWAQQHAWFLDHLEKMYYAFKQQIDKLPNT